VKKILLIEDNEEIRENTAEILELAAYKVFTAEDGKAGVEIALKEKPDLILCDIMMPVLDGYGVLHMLQKNPETQRTPFIFLTAKTERSDMRKGMELGADDYITKPFTGAELLSTIESRLRKNELMKQETAAGLQGLDQLQNISSGRDALQELTKDRNINRYKKKQFIYLEGNRPARLYFIQKGKVKTYISNEEGKDLVVNLYGEGDFLGYTALLENTTYKETAEAMEDTELVIIPREEFDELLNNHPEVARKFIRLLAKNITEKEQQLLGMAYNSLRKKVATALMTLQKKYSRNGEQFFTIDISRENLATIAGTATESLIRTLSDFKTEKLIEISNGVITVVNQKKLENMMN
jgi:DNA-binding response OmpR family regulator